MDIDQSTTREAGDSLDEGSPTDWALACLLLALSLVAAVSSRLDVSEAQRWGAAVLALVQVPPVLIRRRRPRTALLLYAATTPFQYGFGLPIAALTWPVLAFAVLRSPVPGLRVLAATFAGAVAAGAALWLVAGGGSPGEVIGFAAGLAVVTAPLIGVGAVLGAASRHAHVRDELARSAVERTRISTALAIERVGIANEIGNGVVQGVGRVVELATGLRARAASDAAAALAELQLESRRVLAGMRRGLAALRDPDRPVETACAQVGRRAVAPTSSGIALVIGFGAVAVLVDVVVPGPTGTAPQVDQALLLLTVRQELPLTVPFLAVQLLALAWWRTAPLTALAVATAGAVASGLNASTNAVVESGWMVLVYAAGAGAPPLASAIVTTCCSAAVLFQYLFGADRFVLGGLQLLELIGSYALVPPLWAIGMLRRRARRRTAHRARTELALRTRRLVHSQRHSLARDLHDVVGHHVSAIAVQAGAARFVAEPAVLRAAIGHIEESSRLARDALSSLTGPHFVVRTTPLTAGGVADLAQPLRAAGGIVDIRVRGIAPAADSDAERFARHIIGEALTNVLRHCGAGRATVIVSHLRHVLTIDVADGGPVPGHRPTHDGSGLGVIGMRERAELLGGRVAAGPRPGGGWAVRVRLPRPDILLEDEAAAPEIIRCDDAGPPSARLA